MLTIYGRRNSSNVQLVMWTIAELGLPHERLDYGHGHASAKSPAFLEKNPMGLVPVLEDGDVRMFESAAIMRYLAARYGSATFWPADPAERGPLDTWAEWGKQTLSPAINAIFYQTVRLKPENRDAAVLDQAIAALGPLAQVMEDRLAGRTWIGGEEMTFADLAAGHNLYRYFALDWPRPDLPNLAAYYARLQERPAYRDNAMADFTTLRNTI